MYVLTVFGDVKPTRPFAGLSIVALGEIESMTIWSALPF